MFENYTYERLLEDVLNNAPEGIDTRKGSIFYDAVSGILLKVAKLYTDLDLIVSMTTVATATDEALDIRAAEYGLKRLAATPAKYYALFNGTIPEAGERFYYDMAYFVLKKDETGVLFFEAEKPGESGNAIYTGTPAVPVNSIDGLISATFGGIYERGSNKEDDESFRTRVQEKIAGPAENGNRQDYKMWCESIDGIGRARIYPLWNGPNTVKAVLIDPTGQPCSAAKVAEVQEYIDPATKGMTTVVDGKTYIMGDGLGNGRANIGAHFTAVAAAQLAITVSFGAELATGTTGEEAAAEAKEAIRGYFRELTLTANDEVAVVVRISAVGALLSKLESLIDYDNLRMNGETHNIIPGVEEVPILEEVIVE